MRRRSFVGVDVGGTKVAAGLVNGDGEISAQVRVAMVADSSPQRGLESVLSAIAHVIPDGAEGIAGIGICAPGPLDPKTGVILNPPNIPCWRNFPLAAAVRKKYSVPVKLDNDANAAALAEARWGAARGYKNVFYATIGTGIGTGIVFDGKIYHGRTGSAGEGGHVSIDHRGPICNCGKPGCIEIFASGTAIANRARSEIQAGAQSSMLEMSHGDAGAITGVIIAKAADVGDPLAKKIVTEAVEMLALWLSNIVDLLDPDVIVIGGGAAAVYLPFFNVMRTRISDLAVNPHANEVPLVSARYGADSGIAGGAALCA
ncbi:MAG TPA: ROK family protein [Terriglobales bacterium]|nr:ROK family protein [Terriglobales bacterium]